jgi:D-beta-D-heptose 7-phosphate kinase/D-beta-D-heptose 1-phosphate adenosyltransferase
MNIDERDIIALSGGFDPVHVGHLKMIQSATQYGKVVIILNSDEWLMRKKGYMFMPWTERKELLMGIKGVHAVEAADDSDNTVCEALKRINPHYFGNGGDRTDRNTPEKQLCEELDITMLWGLGGGKIQSSSELVRNATRIVDGRNG